MKVNATLAETWWHSMHATLPEVRFTQCIRIGFHFFHDKTFWSMRWLWSIVGWIVLFNEAMHFFHQFCAFFSCIWNLNYFIWIPAQTDFLQIGCDCLAILPYLFYLWTGSKEMNFFICIQKYSNRV